MAQVSSDIANGFMTLASLCAAQTIGQYAGMAIAQTHSFLARLFAT
jgi:hypothetical protein